MPNKERVLGYHDTLLSNIARLGCIVDVEGATARVEIGETTTDFIPFLLRRAADDAEWWPPSIGEQVIVLSLWGDVSQGVIIGSVAQDRYSLAAQGNMWGKRFRDGTTLAYNSDDHTLDIDASQAVVTINAKNVVLNTENATVKAPTMTLDVPKISCTGAITVQGDVIAGGVSLMTHLHGGVQAGKAKTEKPG